MPVGGKEINFPTLPTTLKADDILYAPDRDEFIQHLKSRKQVLRFDHEPKKFVSLSELAATAYSRAGPSLIKKKRPSTAPNKRKNKIQYSSLKSHLRFNDFEDMSEIGQKFEFDPGLITGDVINELFVYPDLFLFVNS